MWKQKTAPRDPGLVEIDEWASWFLSAQLATIAANPAMYDGERATAIAAAKTLAAAVAEQMRAEYVIWQNRVV